MQKKNCDAAARLIMRLMYLYDVFACAFLLSHGRYNVEIESKNSYASRII